MKIKLLLVLLLFSCSIPFFITQADSPYARRIRPFIGGFPGTCIENETGYDMTSHTFGICTNTGYKTILISGSVAPVNATFITQTPDATLTNEQALSALATGILKSTTTTGVLSIATAGTDYQVPITAGDVTTSGATSTIGALKVTNAMLAGSIDLTTKVTGILPPANGGTGVNNSTRTLTINTNSGTIAFSNASKTVTFGNSITFNGTDSTVMTFPSVSANLAPLASPTFTGTVTLPTPSYTAPTYTNSWVDFGAGTDQVGGFFKDPQGMVWMRGRIKSGTVNASAFTLPVGSRPPNRVFFFVESASTTSGGCLLAVNSDGTVVPVTGCNNGAVSINVSFSAN